MTEKTETELFGNEKLFFELVQKNEPTDEDILEINTLITKNIDIDFNKKTDILFGAPAIVFLAQRLNNAIKEGNGDLESKLTEIIKIFLNSPKVDINQQYERDGKVYNTFVLLYDNEELRNKMMERNDFHTTNIENLFNNKKIENIAELTENKKQGIVDTLEELSYKRLQENFEKDKKLLEEYKQKLESGELPDEKEYSENIEKITTRINDVKNFINSREKERDEKIKKAEGKVVKKYINSNKKSVELISEYVHYDELDETKFSLDELEKFKRYNSRPLNSLLEPFTDPFTNEGYEVMEEGNKIIKQYEVYDIENKKSMIEDLENLFKNVKLQIENKNGKEITKPSEFNFYSIQKINNRPNSYTAQVDELNVEPKRRANSLNLSQQSKAEKSKIEEKSDELSEKEKVSELSKKEKKRLSLCNDFITLENRFKDIKENLEIPKIEEKIKKMEDRIETVRKKIEQKIENNKSGYKTKKLENEMSKITEAIDSVESKFNLGKQKESKQIV